MVFVVAICAEAIFLIVVSVSWNSALGRDQIKRALLLRVGVALNLMIAAGVRDRGACHDGWLCFAWSSLSSSGDTGTQLRKKEARFGYEQGKPLAGGGNATYKRRGADKAFLIHLESNPDSSVACRARADPWDLSTRQYKDIWL